MSNTKGWGLTARLISKHFGKLGDTLAEALASFDPETATEADRDRLQATLTDAAIKLAKARTEYQKESTDVTKLEDLIRKDTTLAATLAERLATGEITEDTVNLLCDELEANKARLPIEIQEREEAKMFLDEIQQIVDILTGQLRAFEQQAKQAKMALSRAEAQKDLQTMRTARQEEINSLRNIGSSSTALNAMTKRAAKLQAEADGMKIVADIHQKPMDDAKKLDALRASIDTPKESAAERLKRLASQ